MTFKESTESSIMDIYETVNNKLFQLICLCSKNGKIQNFSLLGVNSQVLLKSFKMTKAWCFSFILDWGSIGDMGPSHRLLWNQGAEVARFYLTSHGEQRWKSFLQVIIAQDQLPKQPHEGKHFRIESLYKTPLYNSVFIIKICLGVLT